MIKASVNKLIGIEIDQDYPWKDTLFIYSGIASFVPGDYEKCSANITILKCDKLEKDDCREIGDGILIGNNTLIDTKYGVRLERNSSYHITLKVTQECNEWLVICMELLLIELNCTFVHAAALEKNKEVVLLPSWGGVGKTATVMRMVRENGWRLLGDDLIILKEDKILPFLKPFVIYPYHRNLFPEVFNENRGRVVTNLKISKLLSKAIPTAKRIMRFVPRLLAFARKHNPQSMRVSPRRIFNQEQLSSGGELKKIIWLERVKGAQVKYSEKSASELTSKTVSVTTMEVFSDRITGVLALCGAGIFDYSEIYLKMHQLIDQVYKTKRCFELDIPTSVSIDMIGNIVLEYIAKEDNNLRLVYVSEHKFIKDQSGTIYTTGQMGNDYFERFRTIFHRILVLGSVEEINSRNERKIVDVIEKSNDYIEYILFPREAGVSDLLLARKLKERVKAILKEGDALAVKAPSFVAQDIVKVGKKNNVPCLVEIVGCPWDALWNHSFKGKLVAPVMWNATRIAIKEAPYVLYVTNEFLQRRYPTKGKSIGCSDVAIQSVDDSILSNRLKKIDSRDKASTLIVGTAGAVNVKYKGQEYVIKALSELIKAGYDIEYQLAGGGDNTYLRKIANQLGVGDKVKFIGAIPHDNIFDWYDHLDLYIHPSKVEGLSRAVIEAMSRGCPVIASDVGGIPELIEGECLFEAASVQEMKACFIKIMNSDLKARAEINYNKSKQYEKVILDSKRAKFYEDFSKNK